MFVSWANIGPFVLKRDAFLSSGMFHDSYSCRGDPGIGFDYEYGIRLWRNNREARFANHAVSIPRLTVGRKRNEKLNEHENEKR